MAVTKPSYAGLQNNTNSKWWKDPGLRSMMWCIIVLYMNAAIWGYDGTLLGNLMANPLWVAYFKDPQGDRLGLIAAIFYFPCIVTPFIASYLGDRIGRRLTLLGAASLSVVGAVINTVATGYAMLLVGRVLVGAALGMQSTVGPALMQEICHPRLRARASALWFIVYQAATMVAAWTCFGTLSWNSNWSWRLPTFMQSWFCLVIVIWIVIGKMPESPRYLIATGKEDQALKILAKYHANGDENDELVQFEMREIKEALEMDHSSASYIDIIKSKGNRHRLAVLAFIAVSGQMCGNALVTYYLVPLLNGIGITNSRTILGINGGLAIFSTLNSAFSAQWVERLGRRPLFLFGTTGVLVCFIIMTALSGAFANGNLHGNAGYAVPAFIYLFFLCYNAAWIVNGALYTVEILPYPIRAKSLSLYVSVQSIAITFNQYVNPIGMDAIGWKYYIVFIVADVMWVIIAYFLIKETRGLSLEETIRLYDAPGEVHEVVHDRVDGKAADAVHDEVADKE